MGNLEPKPLWGFGWAGCCLLGMAAALAACMITGVDVRHWILARIIWNLGWPSTVWFVASFIPSHTLFDFRWMEISTLSPLAPPMMRFSLVTMCLVLIALQVHPRRTGILQLGAIIALGVLVPGLTLSSLSTLAPLWGPVAGALRNANQAASMTLFAFASAAVSALVMMWVTRSVRMGFISAAFLLPGAYLVSETWRGTTVVPLPPLLMLIRGNETWFTWLAWWWNPLFFGCVLTWAVRARLRVRPEHCCQGCGYDLRGTPEGKCPECGVERGDEGAARLAGA